MTEKEIVQALRCCKFGEPCNHCPVVSNENCVDVMHKCAADFIERLTAENADLRKEIEWKDIVIALAQKKQAEAEADRKALINELCQHCGKYKYAHEGACDGCRWKGET